jgi:hypothetical protein
MSAPAPEPVRRRRTLDETPTRELLSELAHLERIGRLDRDLEPDRLALQALAHRQPRH